MAVEVKVPELGESVVEATVGRWHKAEGDTVAAGELLVELETDKVDQEINAPVAGVVGRIVVPEGEDVEIGAVLAEIEATDDAPSDDDGATAPAEPAAAQTEKQHAGQRSEKAPATPVARRMAEAAGVDLEQVAGSGRGGRVTKEDVRASLSDKRDATDDAQAPSAIDVAREAHSGEPPPQRTAPAQATAPRRQQAAEQPVAAARGDDGRREERQKMSRRRRTIARRLVDAQQTAAMLTTFNEIDMSAVIDLRNRWKQRFQDETGVKLGFTSFFTRAVIGALKAFPHLNAEIDGDEMIIKHYYDIGIAVGAEQGLVVPVLRDADRLSFAEIESTVRAFAVQARDGTLALADLMGGTFTITNGGVFGSMLSTPILNPPQVGILGLHNIVERPVAVDGAVEIRPVMYVALTYDHRIVDGREAVQFLVRVKELIEDPERLLLQG